MHGRDVCSSRYRKVTFNDVYFRFAGSGTTANTFAFLLWACLRKPAVVARLKAELREAFPDPSIVPDHRVGIVCIEGLQILFAKSHPDVLRSAISSSRYFRSLPSLPRCYCYPTSNCS